ncbi:MAG: flagellar hook-basal body complex protein [Planctomycetes bacterium]|nr:flagellar hook-basal body complex protein [Planctomycetota bacterium]
MLSSLFSSASALVASQTLLNVVGNNLANSNTVGFKAQHVEFSTQFTQTLQAASAPTASSGGTNPIQIGNGVQVGTTSTNLSQGTFESTGNPYDLAIQGDGFFILDNGSGPMYSRAGAFGLDSTGNLVDPTTGYKVQRTGTVGEGTLTSPAFQIPGNSDIRIPLGMTIPGSATTSISFAGNLNTSAKPPVAAVLTSGQPLTFGSGPATSATLLNSLDQTAVPYAAGDTIQVTGTRVDGSSVTAKYTITGTAADTVGALLNTINAQFLSATPGEGATASLDSGGHLVLQANQGGPAGMTITLVNNTAVAGAGTQFTNFTQTVVGKAGDTATTAIQVFDNQFTPHTLTFTFTKTGPNVWDVKASIDAKDGVITGFGLDNVVSGLTFNENGSFQGVASNNATEMLATQSPFTTGGIPATLSTPLDSLDQHLNGAYAAGDSLLISGTDQNGNPVGPVTLPAPGATVGDLIDSINANFTGAVASLDASGSIQFTAKSSGQSSLSLTLQDTPTNTGGKTTFSKVIEAIRGSDGNDNISFQINNLAGFGTPQVIKLSFGTPNAFSGLTQLGGGTSAAAVNQDGYAQGTLTSAGIGQDGTITGQFTNGRTESLAQVALATFTNPEGLLRSTNNYFAATANTGPALVTTPLVGSAGSVQSGSLESSNVDVGAEFTQLVAAQRGYQVNAQAFSAANQMLQETANLLR